jgi:hypothetical protein
MKLGMYVMLPVAIRRRISLNPPVSNIDIIASEIVAAIT